MSNENSQNQNQNPSSGGKPNGSGPRFGTYWIYGIIALFLLGLNLFSMGKKAETITSQQLRSLVLSGDVEKIVVIKNKNEARLFLTEAGVEKEANKTVARTPFNQKNRGPHYVYNIGSLETFEKSLSEMQQSVDANKRIEPIFETELDLQEWVIEQTEHSHATEEDRNRFEFRHSG